MAIYRGPGGAGDATNDASSQAILAIEAATAAASSESAAADSALSASNSASAAATSASNAETSATNAAASETNAASSATSAASSATAAQTAETNAETAETNAETAETNAATSATNASTSATLAQDWAIKTSGPVSGSDYSSKYNAQLAASSASSASTSAATATTEAGNAASSASSAAASAAAAAASYDNFDDRYLGTKSTSPTLDNDGNALVTGALYYNNGTVTIGDKGMWVYDGAQWLPASAASQAILVTYDYTATSGQTTFTGADNNAVTLGYTPGSIIVTLNGVVLDQSDYTATTGSSVVLAVGATTGDEVNVLAFSTFDVANTYTQAQADARFLLNLNPNYTGTLTGGTGVINIGSGQLYKDSSGNVGIGTSSPSYKLDVVSSGDLSARVSSTGTNNAASLILQSGSGATSGLFAYARFINNDTNSQDWRIGTYGTNNLSIVNAKAGTTPVILDTSGNLGLGVTPSATSSTYKNVQNGGATFMGKSGAVDVYLNANATFNSGWKYIYDGVATKYSMNDSVAGGHTWFTAASGTAGDAISFTQAMTLDANGRLLVGVTTADSMLSVGSSATLGLNTTTGGVTTLAFGSVGTGSARYGSITKQYDSPFALTIKASNSTADAPILFNTSGSTERMRIDPSGNLLVGTTATDLTSAGIWGGSYAASGYGRLNFIKATASGTGSTVALGFYYNGSTVGTIQCTSTATSYNTSSDYRLKENIQPMQNALGVVAQLKPVTYTWKADGSDGQGFIAHELQDVVPDCVTGEKDAVDSEGNPVYQGIDTSFLVATLAKAIQELNDKVTKLEEVVVTQQTEINELKGSN